METEFCFKCEELVNKKNTSTLTDHSNGKTFLICSSCKKNDPLLSFIINRQEKSEQNRLTRSRY